MSAYPIISKFLLYIIYAGVSSFGLYKIKVSNLNLNFDLFLGGAFYVAGFLIWLLILKNNQLSVAFPLAAGALIIATQIVGFYFLGEQLGVYRAIGIALIILGFIFINRVA